MKIADLLSPHYRLVTAASGRMRDYAGFYAGDLLSNVLKSAVAGNVLITVMANPNAVAVASLIGLPAIVLCEGRSADPALIARADAEGIALIETGLKAVDVVLDFARRGCT